MNYGLLAVTSLRSKEAPFPLNNPLAPTTLEVACNGANALHAVYYLASVRQILKLELAYHGSKFSSLLRRVSKVLKFAELLC